MSIPSPSNLPWEYTVHAGRRWKFILPRYHVIDYCFPYRFSFFQLSGKEQTKSRGTVKLGQRLLRYMILNIVSETVHNVFVWLATPELSWLLAFWNCYPKSSSTTHITSGTRMLTFTQDIVVCSVRVNWFLGSIDLVIYSTLNEKGVFQMRTAVELSVIEGFEPIQKCNM